MSTLFRLFKKKAYFFVAAYFGLWARIFLRRWSPTIITVIGSSGKTTLLHLLESQFGSTAIYSHKANSAFGIPFNILGLERKTFGLLEWPLFAILAPFKALRPIPAQKLYTTEADTERPGEGYFLARLLKPHYLIWLSQGHAHAGNYDHRAAQYVAQGNFEDKIRAVIAREFGEFVEYARTLVVLNKDDEYITHEAHRTQAQIEWVSMSDIRSIDVKKDVVVFDTAEGHYSVPQLVPLEVGMSIIAVACVVSALGGQIDQTFKRFTLPPSRSSVLIGIKNTVLIDSSYNATIDGMKVMLELFGRYPAQGEKWLVLGDMVEQGENEAMEHTLLARLVAPVNPARIILVGPRLAEHTLPLLATMYDKERITSFLMPADAYKYLIKEIMGGETILFKGARFLEGIVEKLLQNPADVNNLCRREEVWVRRRRAWGL